jgi:hypothetical protein
MTAAARSSISASLWSKAVGIGGVDRGDVRPTGVYPSPNSSMPTGFTLLAGSNNQVIAAPSSMLPIDRYQFTLNAPSSAGAKVNFVALQADIG